MSEPVLRRWPFLTGSRAYGTVNDQSDTDIVVLIHGDLAEDFKEQFDFLTAGSSNDRSFMVAEINIIPVYTIAEYDSWRAATKRMIEWKQSGWPVPKEVAIAEIDKEFALRGIPRNPLIQPISEDDCPF